MSIKIQSKEIIEVSVNSLVPHPKNMNKHSPEQIERLCKIIEYQGFRNPLIVQKGTNLVVAGHGRIMAAKKLNIEKVPVMYQEFESEEQLYAAIVSDNSIASWAELDLSMVNAELENLGPDLDIDLLGIKDFVLEPIEKYDSENEDEVPEITHTPITKRGDVWLLGEHRVMCGDSTMIDDVEKLMEGMKADMVFTDPPYGYKYESNYQNKHEMLKNDDTILDFIPNAYSFSSDNSTIYLCTSHQVIDVWKPLIEKSFNYKNMIIWKKNNWSMGDLSGSFAGQHEILLFASKGKNKIIGKRDSDVWSFDRVPPTTHPTMKPVELVEFALSKWQSGKVLDFFLGSGSTLIACEKTNRKCYGLELDEKYCDVILNRWQNFTEKEATLESNGETYNSLKASHDG